MRVECVIEVDYESEERAEAVLRSIAVDNEKYAAAERKGRRVTVKAAAESAPSLLHTIEDLLACMKVADELVRQGSDPDALSDLDG
jgi:tRNA threonylcarbamoyladenosine modification (KEOPS) complex  Pcc1 subunit